MSQNITTLFSELAKSRKLVEFLSERPTVTLGAGNRLLRTGETISSVPLVVGGALKVSREAVEGKRHFLYHIKPGESCAMTLVSTLSNDKSRVTAETLQETDLVSIPVREVREWFDNDRYFRRFVLATYRQRFDELIEMVDHLAFGQVHLRLISLLNDRARLLDSRVVEVTHQELAVELNSSREVISRVLKQLEAQGKLELGRNRIKLLDPL